MADLSSSYAMGPLTEYMCLYTRLIARAVENI